MSLANAALNRSTIGLTLALSIRAERAAGSLDLTHAVSSSLVFVGCNSIRAVTNKPMSAPETRVDALLAGDQSTVPLSKCSIIERIAESLSALEAGRPVDESRDIAASLLILRDQPKRAAWRSVPVARSPWNVRVSPPRVNTIWLTERLISMRTRLDASCGAVVIIRF